VIRDDLSDRLVHLTKGQSEKEAAQNFLNIVRTKTLRGGTGYMKGGFRCVCFTEAPIGKLAHILAQPSVHGMQYAPLGIMLDKLTLFQAGGRPVIYQPDSDYHLLAQSQRFRHKRYEPDAGIDFSWEREWRILTDAFCLNPASVTLIVPNRAWSDYLFKRHADDLQSYALVMKDMAYALIDKCPWHFLVLEDLGLHVNFEYVP
jgi:hypothetical protein